MSANETDQTPATSRRGLLRGAAALSMGAIGVARGSDAVTAQESSTEGGRTWEVDMTDDLVYVPEEISISPGDTIRWVNVGSIGHTVTAYEGEIPDDAEYFASGGFDTEQAARDGYPAEGNIAGGESYSHTFEVEGTYEYLCIPHETVGMVGTVTVAEGATPTGAGGSGDSGDGGIPLPGGDIGAAWMAILLAIGGLAALSVLAGEFIGALRRESPEGRAVQEAEPSEPVREIGHDEFDPIGTASLIVIYFLILVVMWVFVYFIEFLGRSVTVVG